MMKGQIRELSMGISTEITIAYEAERPLVMGTHRL